MTVYFVVTYHYSIVAELRVVQCIIRLSMKLIKFWSSKVYGPDTYNEWDIVCNSCVRFFMDGDFCKSFLSCRHLYKVT